MSSAVLQVSRYVVQYIFCVRLPPTLGKELAIFCSHMNDIAPVRFEIERLKSKGSKNVYSLAVLYLSNNHLLPKDLQNSLGKLNRLVILILFFAENMA